MRKIVRIRSHHWSLISYTASQTESIIPAVHFRPGAETGSCRRTAYRRFAEPASSAGNMHLMIIIKRQIFIIFRQVFSKAKIRIPIIIAKFKYIAMHIVEPPCVRLFLTHRLHFFTAVAAIPSRPVKVALGITGMEMSCCSGTACVFPFGFSRHSETVLGKITLEIFRRSPFNLFIIAAFKTGCPA